MSSTVAQLHAPSNAALTPSQAAAAEFHAHKEAGGSVRGAVIAAMTHSVTGGAIAPPPPAAPPKPAPVVGARVPKVVDADLVYILSTPRGHDGKSEKKFNNWVITKINKMGYKPVIMEEGAVFAQIGTTEDCATLFSCHMDSVHDSRVEELQALAFDPQYQHITLDTVAVNTTPKGKDPTWVTRRVGSCLGADDGAGVWLMLKMMEAGVKGGYMFHRGEERGCVSSAAMARKQEKWLSQWKAAIAFDRPKDFEVITHQGSVECASDEYGKALAEALSANPDDELKFNTSSNGGTTDTRQYRGIIPECINVGVGYFHHHTADEYVDYAHLKALMEQCCKLDWKALEAKVTRDPKAQPKYYSSGYTGGWQGSRSSYPNSPAAAPSSHGGGVSTSAKLPKEPTEQTKTTLETLYHAAKSTEDIIDWFEMDPELTAKCFMQALIEGRMEQIKYQMLLSKTLKA